MHLGFPLGTLLFFLGVFLHFFSNLVPRFLEFHVADLVIGVLVDVAEQVLDVVAREIVIDIQFVHCRLEFLSVEHSVVVLVHDPECQNRILQILESGHQNDKFLKFIGIEPTQNELTFWLSKFDKGGGEEIELEEFIAIMNRFENLEDPILTFRIMDKNNNGMISEKEFKASMLELDPYLSSEDIEDLFDTCDEDSDGQLNWVEFQESWHKIRKQVEEDADDADKKAKRKAKMEKLHLGGVHSGLGFVSKGGKKTVGVVGKPKRMFQHYKKKKKMKKMEKLKKKDKE